MNVATEAAYAAAKAQCPKHMDYGPCGAVYPDGNCELGGQMCPYVSLPMRHWDGPDELRPPLTPTAQALFDRVQTQPLIIADFPAAPLDIASLRQCAQQLGSHVDLVLSGDHGQARVQFAPSLRAALIKEAGATAALGINARDRNAVAIEGELAGIAALGCPLVHAITGDHPLSGHRPDTTPVFELDSTEIAALARHYGLLVSVAESPAAPPIAERPRRLATKVDAGASLCFVNHCGGVEPTWTFINECHALGITVGFIPCIPIILDEDSANVLRSFPTLALPDGYLDRILSSPFATDRRRQGIAEAIAMSTQMLELPGVVGVDLSGGPTVGQEAAYCSAIVEIADGIRAVVDA